MSQRRKTSMRVGEGAKPITAHRAQAVEDLQAGRCDRRMVIGVSVVLLFLGIYQSVHFYGFAAFPQADSWEFIATGHELLSFEVPSSFKRAPVVCILQAGISRLLPIERADLHAGWLLQCYLAPIDAGAVLAGGSAVDR